MWAYFKHQQHLNTTNGCDILMEKKREKHMVLMPLHLLWNICHFGHRAMYFRIFVISQWCCTSLTFRTVWHSEGLFFTAGFSLSVLLALLQWQQLPQRDNRMSDQDSKSKVMNNIWKKKREGGAMLLEFVVSVSSSTYNGNFPFPFVKYFPV